MKSIQVLLIEDSEADAMLLLAGLRGGGYEPVYRRVDSLAELESALHQPNWEIIISDYSLPEFSALHVLEQFQKTERDIPFIVVSGAVGEDVAVATIKAGASDYIMKYNLARLIPAIERELREAARRREHRKAEVALRQSEERFSKVFKASPAAISISHVTDGRFIDVNDSFLQLVGYERDEVLGQTPVQLNLWTTAADRQALLRQLLDQGRAAGSAPHIPALRSWVHGKASSAIAHAL